MTDRSAPRPQATRDGDSDASRVSIVTPAPFASRTGNRVTAVRWAGHLRSLGYRVRLLTSSETADGDVLLALHASKSRPAQDAFHLRYPDRPIVVTLTGTDLYQELSHPTSETLESLDRAAALIALQEEAVAALPERWARKTHVVPQSSRPVAVRRDPRSDAYEVVFLGHLRPVKDPNTLLAALRRLPAESSVVATLAGEVLDPRFGEIFGRDLAATPRAVWVGPLRRHDALFLLSGARALVSTSRVEGGANVVSEALIHDVPVLATDIPGSRGVLGAEHPGLFPVGDAERLSALLSRLEREQEFAAELQRAGRTRAPRFHPDRECEALLALLTELGCPPPRGNPQNS